MIFLTVGTQEPFDRLVRAVDAWAALHDEPLFGQLGALGPESHRPAHFPWAEFMAGDDYAERLASCRLLVAHAGMGSIISALGAGKPILILPRRASLGEHRNEHQLATAAKFAGRPGVHVAMTEDEVGPAIDRILAGLDAGDGGAPSGGLAPFASDTLIAALADFIHARR